MLPKLFVASSVESLPVANSVNVSLDHDAEVTVWKDGFELSKDTISSLVGMANRVDFAVFIFTPDDVINMRQEEKNVVRDNVLFELGLFIGTIGLERCIILKPRDQELHFPTDLLGLTIADYNGSRTDNNLEAAVNPACSKIKSHMESIGLAADSVEEISRERKRSAYDYPITIKELRLLNASSAESVGETSSNSFRWRAFP